MQYTKKYPLAGFDKLFDDIMSSELVQSPRSFKNDKFYPPYNTYNEGEKTFIEVAVTGFKKKEIKVYYDEDGLFVIEGTSETKDTSNTDDKIQREYFVRNLSTKNFTRKFSIPKNTKLNSVKIQNGLLIAEFERIKPDIKYIDIN